MNTCWECKQEKPLEELKVTGSAHINRGNKPHQWVQIFTCSTCERDRLRKCGVFSFGELVRSARVHEFSMDLRTFGLHTIGPDVMRLSQIERGTVEATKEEKAAIEDGINCLRIARQLCS